MIYSIQANKMKSSYRLLRIFGISVELHISFILFFLLLFIVSSLESGLISGIGTLILFFILFTIVLLHELMHSFAAIKNGIKVPRIILLPIGGLANVEIPEKPEKELMIAIAGPLLNFFLAFLAAFILVIVSPDPIGVFQQNLPYVSSLDPANIQNVVFTLPGILTALIFFNLSLGLFNMLPGFPMDGGRVFRAVLALWMDHVKATEIAVRVGQFIFLGMMFFGFLSGSFMLLIIGMFLFFASGSELNVAKLSHSLQDLKIGTIAIKNFGYTNDMMTISEFLRLIARPEQRFYPIVKSDGKLYGILDIYDLSEIKNESFSKKTARELARGFEIIEADLKVKDKIQDIVSKEFLVVVSKGQVIGYLTPQHILEIANFYGVTRQK